MEFKGFELGDLVRHKAYLYNEGTPVMVISRFEGEIIWCTYLHRNSQEFHEVDFMSCELEKYN